MDDLVRLGTLALVGLAVITIILFIVLLIMLIKVWNAIVLGDYLTLLRYGAGVILLAGAYIGVGFWLQRTGKI
jgi:hypothetical protein